MKKTYSLLSPFNSNLSTCGLCTGVSAGANGASPLRRRYHRKSIGAERDLQSHADLSLTKRHTLRGCAALQSA